MDYVFVLESSKTSAGQLTENTIKRYSQLAAIEDNFMKSYDKEILQSSHRTVHKRATFSRGGDLQDLIAHILKDQIFKKHPGRRCPGFNTTMHEIKVTRPKQLKLKVEKIIKDFANERAVQLRKEKEDFRSNLDLHFIY